MSPSKFFCRAASIHSMGSELPDLEDVACMSSLRASLLSWYGQNHRTLPWRRTPPNAVGEAAVAATEQHSWSTAAADVAASRSLSASDFAYGVWVSETMSQQTQGAHGLWMTFLPFLLF